MTTDDGQISNTISSAELTCGSAELKSPNARLHVVQIICTKCFINISTVISDESHEQYTLARHLMDNG